MLRPASGPRPRVADESAMSEVVDNGTGWRQGPDEGGGGGRVELL
jgi:hypothetical protein